MYLETDGVKMIKELQTVNNNLEINSNRKQTNNKEKYNKNSNNTKDNTNNSDEKVDSFLADNLKNNICKVDLNSMI
jgi:hypothetical protein